MFSLLQSQNTLQQVPITITLPSSNITYTGTAINTTINTSNSNAVYGIKINGSSISKRSKGPDTFNSSSDLQLSVNAGSTISYTIVPMGDENYTYVFDGKSDLTGTFTIIPATLNLTASVTSLTYNGTSQNLSYSVTGTGVDTGYSVSNTSNTNSGSYTATLTKSSNNYVLGATTSIPWTISKAILTITTSNASMTYGSSAPTSSFGYSLFGLLGADTANVVTGLNGISVGSAAHSTTATSSSNVGTYPIATNVSGLSATNYTFTATNGTLTISAATLNLTASATSFTYNGASQNLSYNVTGTGADAGYSVSNTSNTNAGSYTATLTKSSTNYVLGTSTINWSIGKAPITITSNNASMTYGSSLPTFGYTPSGFKGSDTSSVITGLVTHNTTGSSTANAGTYAIVPNISGLSATNYTFTAANGTLTISAATLNLSGAANQSFIYNGSSRGLSFSVTGAVASDAGYLVSNTSSINVGSFTATLTKSSSNYVLGATTTIPWSITPATLTTSTISASVPYNGSSQQVFVFGTLNGTSSGGTATGTNAGTYPVTINGTGNYTGSISGNLFITQLQGGVTFNPGPYADIAPGDNSVISFSSYVQSQTGPISFSASASGPGSGDANITSTSVQNNNNTTAGFVVTIVASAGDTTNYINFSSTITIKFYAYVAPVIVGTPE